jgi:hypothetical protein
MRRALFCQTKNDARRIIFSAGKKRPAIMPPVWSVDKVLKKANHMLNPLGLVGIG